MDEKKLREAEWRMDCLASRADALGEKDARADGASGTKKLYMSQELELGGQGYGEVEFYVTATYKTDFSLQGLKSVDWYDNNDQKMRNYPRAAIEAAINKIIARSSKDLLDRLAQAL